MSTKKLKGFRLSDETSILLGYLCEVYSRLSETDFVDMALKELLLAATDKKNIDPVIGNYIRGETDAEILRIYKDVLKKRKTS